MNEQKLEQEQSFAEERRIRSSFLDFMAKTINKYGKTLLNEQRRKMNREGKKCVLYSRVSTEMQVDGFSLEGQITRMKTFAEREEMDIVKRYEDAGKSGKSIAGRPAFQLMLADIQEGKQIDYILVYKLSRFGRNAADILNSLQKVQDYGVNLISVEEGIDSSQASGKLLISVLSAVAEIERENILEQTMNGRKTAGHWEKRKSKAGFMERRTCTIRLFVKRRYVDYKRARSGSSEAYLR